MVVDVSAVTEPNDSDEQPVVLDGVKDAIVANPHTEARAALQGSCARRARILAEQCDSALNALLRLWVELTQSSRRGRA